MSRHQRPFNGLKVLHGALTDVCRCLVVMLVLMGPAGWRCAQAVEFRETHDGEKTTWQAAFDPAKTKLLNHGRLPKEGPDAGAAEGVQFQLDPPATEAHVELSHELPPARVIDELTLSVQIRASLPGATVLLRVIYPEYTNPADGRPVYDLIPGDTYRDVGQWQTLRCTTTAKQIQEQVHLLRNKHRNPAIDSRNAYVDRVIVQFPLQAGRPWLLVDDLRFGPIVSPQPEAVVQLTSATKRDEPLPVRLEQSGLRLNDRPFFPRMVAYHGESLDILKLTGINVVWVPDFEDQGLLTDLREHGLWAAATPPRATSDDGGILDTRNVSMLPFGEDTRSILFWNLGTRVPPDHRDKVIGFAKQARSADRYERPVMVDIIPGEERAISRYVRMLGVSRHVANTTFSFKQYRDWLVQRRELAQPGSFMWTWVQTEPASNNQEWRAAAGRTPIVLEPEQIRLQVYAALAAGCRGVGFWKTLPLDADTPGALERRLIIAQLGLELELLTPWLAGGTVETQKPFGVEVRESLASTRRGLDFRNSPTEFAQLDDVLRDRASRQARAARRPGELEAAIIRSERGTLVLPIWYGTGAEFCPGQMAGNNATILVEGVPDTAQAWEITTTRIKHLPTTRVPGGLQVTLNRFDQTSAIVFTSDRSFLPELEHRQREMAEPSAKIACQLAKAKLDRVAQVDAALQELGQGQYNATAILYHARSHIEQAEIALGRGGYDNARERSAEAMQLLRILQRLHWDDAMAMTKMRQAVASPHTVSFQTLPDHWRLMARFGRSGTHGIPNLLRSGDFEDRDTMVAEGWRHDQNDVEGVWADADFAQGFNSKQSLRLVAGPKNPQAPPLVVPHSPVIVTTPAVPVHAGQVVFVRGMVRVPRGIVGSHDGVMLYDSLCGPAGALRWHGPVDDWQTFTLIREIPQSGEFSLTLVLNGMGEAQFDQLKIWPHNPRQDDPVAEQPAAPPADRSARNFFDRLPRLPEFPARN